MARSSSSSKNTRRHGDGSSVCFGRDSEDTGIICYNMLCPCQFAKEKEGISMANNEKVIAGLQTIVTDLAQQ